MKWRLVHKLLIALFASTAVVLVLIFWLVRSTIGSGFADFIRAQEQAQLVQAAPLLASVHENQGGWDALAANPQRLNLLLRNALVGDEPMRPPGPGTRPSPGSGPPPRDHRSPPGGPRARRNDSARPDRPPPVNGGLPQRVSLLDARGEVVIGPAGLMADEDWRVPIESGDRVVGYLYAAAPRGNFTPLEQGFLERSRRGLLLALALGLGVAAVLSVLLARNLVRPVSAIAQGIRSLSQGNFAVRVDTGSQDEIARLGRDVNQLARTLADHEQSRQRWMADIAHELRTPLTIINGELEAMADGVRPLTPDNLAAIRSEVGRFAGLIEDLKQLALSDSGALTYRMAPLDLGDTLSEALQAFEARIQASGLALDWQPAGHPVPVHGDPNRLRQLVDNLLENAVRYTDAPGQVRVRLSRQRSEAVIEFADTAPGISANDCERIFDRLYRVEASRNRGTGGSGLGLAIARNIVEAHGGRIAASPGALGGLDVTVTLPLDS